MFHDSNSADPATPPPELKPSNGDGSGQVTEPPEPTVPTPKVTQINVIEHPKAGSNGVVPYSYEGQVPNLANAVIELWFDDHTMTRVTSGYTAAGIVTIPRILGEAQISNYVSPGANTGASQTQILVTHVNASSVVPPVSITLPGVRAIDPNYAENGFVKGLKVVGGNVAEFYEDGGEPDLTTVTVEAWYQGLSSKSKTATGAALDLVSPGSVRFALGTDYVFTDYWTGFPGTAYAASTTKRYAYGVDLSAAKRAGSPATGWASLGNRAGTVFALISPAATTGRHIQATSFSKFVPISLGRFYYVGRVAEAGITWRNRISDTDTRSYWYSDDTSHIGVENADTREAWLDTLIRSELKLKVWYMNEEDEFTLDREVGHLVRAKQLGNARVEKVPDFRLYEEGPEAVQVELGYYGYENLGGANTPNGAGFPNTVSLTIPIARFTEQVRFERRDKTVDPKPLEWPAINTNTIDNGFLEALKVSYILYGIYDFNGEVLREVPVSLWRASWFAPGDLRGFDGSVPTEITMEVTIRQDGGHLSANGYGAYAGIDTTVPIIALPAR